MAESMQGLKRTHRCGELSAVNVGETVTIMGWVQKNRNKGGLVFTDVRDRSGIIQVVCEEGTTEPALIEKAASLRSEYVVAIVGKVARRSGAVNDKIATGEIEVIPSELRILSEAMTPPFPIEVSTRHAEGSFRHQAQRSDEGKFKDKRRNPSQIPLSGFKKTGSSEKS